jgi:general secretion pathway protein E
MTPNTPVALDANQLNSALLSLRQQRDTHQGLWSHLMATLNTPEDVLAQALWEFHGISTLVDISDPGVELLRTLPSSLSDTETGVISTLFEITYQEKRYLLCDDPWSADAGKHLSAASATYLAIAKPGQLKTLQRLGVDTPASGAVASPAGDSGTSPGSLVVQFVDDAIAHAYREGASDIHFETSRAGIQVKFRLDGVMAPGPRFDDPNRAEEVISRIKVMSQLDITERRRPQDGRIHWGHPELGTVDLRVSIMPSIFGEDAVLRLLDKAQLRQSQQSVSLGALGFEGALAMTLRSLASRPHGMLLITGPTGSGKTTTVYAALSEVNDGLEKIITIEDPVEYELPGVLQIPVNEQKGLTFATGLRSILRHDPDKILVGEIRDAETAQIAVQSALTGHLVFTTVHANSLFDVLGRFHHFGIEPFAIASALNGIVVQRLLRKLCTHCVEWRTLSTAEHHKLSALDVPVPDRVATPKGCPHCRNSGYRGRFVIAEVHQLDDTIRDLMVQKATVSQLKTAIYTDRSQRLLNQAVLQVAQGRTSLEEVVRVIGLV